MEYDLFMKTSIVMATIGFGILALFAHTVEYFPWDLKISILIQSWRGLGGLFSLVSWPGYYPQALVIAIIIVGIMVLSKLYWESLSLVAGLGASEIVVHVLKTGIGRLRPMANLVHVNRVLTDGSFPSGHVVDYIVVAGFLLFLTITLAKKTVWRQLAVTVLVIIILLVGPSRIYLGEHWASDVLGGYLLGIVLLWLTVKLYRFCNKLNI